MAFFRESDAISGKQARAFVSFGERREELFYAKNIEATIEKNKVDVPILGRTNTPQRSAGWKGSGTLTVYYVTSIFRQLMWEYIKTGKDFWFELQITNEDPTSGAGKQTARLLHCNLDSIIAAKFDASSDDMLEEELPFTFSDYELPDLFSELN
ncbi:phage tail tube protein [Cohnella phaseoli]|uniref:Tail tube protein n=1 Tax=Cohnella phaseoli TaxID=456490 RepID=A0A3D9IUW6_9BACL|nr:phage tail tube protein [Cohnella phaseoli]RED65475.1 tail tube protein [Cohnella phaseoli]